MLDFKKHLTEKELKSDSLKLLLDQLKERKVEFYRRIWANWNKRAVAIERPKFFWHQPLNNDYGRQSEYNIINHSLSDMGLDKEKFITLTQIEVIHEKYWDRFIKNIYPKKVEKVKGNIPHLDRTTTIHELILRGWIHDMEFKEWNHNLIYLRCHCAPLVWPETFEHHQDAIEALRRYGINGRCGTILPKSK